MSDQVERLKLAASAVRLVLIGLVTATWPRAVEWAHRWGRVDEGKRDDFRAQRWRVAGWLFVIELVLGQNVLGRFLALTIGPAA